MLRKVMVPLDGSERAEAVLPWAISLAREKHLSVTLARVTRGGGPPSGGTGAAPPEPLDRARSAAWDAAARYLEDVRARLRPVGVDADVMVREGPTAQAILDLADEVDASMVLLAMDGGEAAFGGTAEQVAWESTRPLLLVPSLAAGEVRPPACRRVLVPLDGSALAERALDVVTELADDDAEVVLLQVVNPVPRTLDTAEGRLPIGDVEATRRYVTEARAYLESACQALADGGSRAQASVAVGEPDREILAGARAHAADLIVMVTHGTTGPTDNWLGSVANDVVRQSTVPVYLVSARALEARSERGYLVADIMTRRPLVVRPDETLDAVIRKMLRRRISGAPVVDAHGTLIGLISEYDLLRWYAAAAEVADLPPGAATAARSPRATHVAEVMSRLAVTIEESMTLASVVPILLELPYRRLPVTRHGRLVGVLARADILWAMVEQEEPAPAPERVAVG